MTSVGASVLLNHTTEPVGPVGQFLVVVFCLAIGGVLVLVGWSYLQTYLRVRQLEPVEIRRLTDTETQVELTGLARSHEKTSLSPFTETNCLLHEWKLERNNGGSETTDWITLDSGETRHPFVLEDDTGTVLVDPEGGTLGRLTEETIETGDSPPATVQNYLQKSDVVDRGHEQKLRCIERRLDPGDDVHVFGPVRRVGNSVDMPGGVDAVVGLSDADSGGTVGENSLLDYLDQITEMQFMITGGTEVEAQTHLAKQGLFIAGFGAVFGLTPLVFVLL